jgi:hypothetical protein
MAIQFIIEDGTGLADATAYADLTVADQYLENTGRKDAWRVFSSKERQAALIQGADYLDQKFRRAFKGIRFSSTQRLEWPRAAVVDELGNPLDPPAGDVGGFPEEIANGSIEYALEAASSPLAPTPTTDPSGLLVTSIREKVDVLEESKQFSDKYPVAVSRAYPRAKLVIRRWLRPVGALTARI